MLWVGMWTAETKETGCDRATGGGGGGKGERTEGGLLTFPGTLSAPPIARTSLTRRNAAGSAAAARARLVSGPSATMETESGGSARRMARIWSGAGSGEGVKRRDARSEAESEGLVLVLEKRSFHVSAALRCGCCYPVSGWSV
jgi:hypothetical protein